MTDSLAPLLRQKFFTPGTNTPLAGGKVYTYIAATSTPQATYTDATNHIANANPVILDANGEAAIYFGPGLTYKINVLDTSNVQVAGYPVDNVSGADTIGTAAALMTTLRADLASASSAALGAGLSGYSQAQAYAAATVGGRLNKLSTMATTCGRLSNLITGTGPNPGADPFDSCHFIPYNGNSILVGGILETIPDGQLAASGGIIARYTNCYVNRTPGQTLADNTFYFIYVAKVSGVLVLNFSTTGYLQNGPTWGNATKSNDESSTLVGICNIKYVGGIPTTFGGAHGQTIAGYFNRFRTSLFSQLTGGAVTSTTLVALPNGATVFGMPASNYMEWVQWYDDAPTLYYNADSGNPTSVGALLTLDMGVNSTTVGFSPSHARAVTADQQCIPIPGRGVQVDATGHYYAQMLYKTSAGAAYFEGLCWADGIML